MEGSDYSKYFDEDADNLDQLEEKKKKASGKQVRLAWLMATLSVLLVISGFYLTQGHDDVPSELIGVWRTESPQYADRFIEIRPVTISFGTGAGTELTGFIRSVQANVEDGRVMYAVKYTANGTDSLVFLLYTYSSREGQTLQLKNQEDIVWRKE
jgi:hypothetical protein